ncbi:hypothetical protein N0V90_002897 [Kalmusia sp. IMI 367209]|nr:hypothetical protein N0V90_002897 [Kalmusia sp. IMI 367209]
MHESFSQEPNSRERYRDDAIHHYNKAMREIFRAPQSEPSVTAVLVASVVFYSLECLRGCFYRALQHVQSGVKIISQRGPSFPTDLHQQSLLSVSLDRDFLALQNHIMELGNPSRCRAFDAIRGFDPPIPARFETVDDALYYIQVVYNEGHCLFDHYESLTQAGSMSSEILSNDIGARYEKVCQKLIQWSLAFASLDGSFTGPHGATERQAVSILRIYYSALKVMLDNVFSGDCFDRYDADIARILEEAGIFLHSQVKGTQAFSLSFGVIAPLFMLAWRCNYAPTRDKSLELLSANRRREGLWDSQTAVLLAQRVIAFKSRMATMGYGALVHIFNISFVSETACQMEIVIKESPAPLNAGLEFENLPKERKHIEIVHFDPIQLFE